ncbi:MAG: histidine phosphatase family protein [Candidatus Kapaibacterium sp.]|nr:histidine phosphatase family protein [Ignavibacteriota bacterium]MCB9220317.1 histidine phosphatase family protein [Ignavibacteria bacterium]
MKKIFIVRHAKSDWNNNLIDFERPLNERGHNDAPIMAEKIKSLGERPQLIISSPAMRAKTTAKYFAEVFGYADECIMYHHEIYDIGQKFTIQMLTKISPKIDSVMVFGHNPDQSHLATYLSNENIGNMPTCAVVGVEMQTENWSEIKNAESRLICYEYPKKDD